MHPKTFRLPGGPECDEMIRTIRRVGMIRARVFRLPLHAVAAVHHRGAERHALQPRVSFRASAARAGSAPADSGTFMPWRGSFVFTKRYLSPILRPDFQQRLQHFTALRPDTSLDPKEDFQH